MTRTTKPYRRYRARGQEAGGGDGLDELRALTAREAVAAPGGPATGAPPGAPPGARPGRGAPSPEPRAPGRLEREQRRALSRTGRRWWSLRGLGPAGWIGRIAIVLLIAVIAWGIAGWFALQGAVGQANAKITPTARKALDKPTGGLLGTPTNTLILGVDAPQHHIHSRADSILIMRTDPGAGRIKYLSIPRDWRVDLPKVGTQKINAAYFFYGQSGMIKAVKRLTGLPINHIIVVHFQGLSKMVDAVGGVTVNNPTALVNCPYAGGRTVSFPKGTIALDGPRALEFARVRKCDSDLQRALRQQSVVAALRGKVLSWGSLWQAPWRGADVVRTVATDIGTADIVKMGWLQWRLSQNPGDRMLLFGEPQSIGGIDYIVGTNPDRNLQQISSFVSSK